MGEEMTDLFDNYDRMLEDLGEENFQYNGKINEAKKSVAQQRNKVKNIDKSANQVETQLTHQKGINTIHSDFLGQLGLLATQIGENVSAESV